MRYHALFSHTVSFVFHVDVHTVLYIFSKFDNAVDILLIRCCILFGIPCTLLRNFFSRVQ